LCRQRLPHRLSDPQFSHLWWSGWAGGAAGLAVAFITMALEQVIKRIP